ncbi:MAG: hypothetical protein U7123_17600 [Potamolinea sp.]
MFENDTSTSFYLKANSEVTNVGIDNITLKDERRNRELPVRVYYPQESGSFPVIIFSHGTGGSKESFSYLGKFWASCGYVCLHPTHFGSDFSLLQKIGLQTLLEITNQPEASLERPQDISFLIDSLSELEQQIPALAGKINQSFIGVSGHSSGAYTTMLVAGATIEMPGGKAASVGKDDRAWVFLPISPPGTNRLGLNDCSWDKIAAPVMSVSGTKDQGWEGEPPRWRMEAFKYMRPGDKYHVLIKEAHHFSFDPDLSTGRKPFQRINRINNIAQRQNPLELERKMLIKSYLKTASIAFWDAYLKFRKPAKDYLYSDALTTSSKADVTIFCK